MADLDHRFMAPPFLRVSDRRTTPSGDEVFQWDLRLAQPNVSQVAMPVIHSLEHFLGTLLRSASDKVITVAPMGCQTGFYLGTIGIGDFEEMADLLAEALVAIGEADSVPLANTTRCGWAENHTLVGVQALAGWLLSRRSEWHDPGKDAHEV